MGRIGRWESSLGCNLAGRLTDSANQICELKNVDSQLEAVGPPRRYLVARRASPAGTWEAVVLRTVGLVRACPCVSAVVYAAPERQPNSLRPRVLSVLYSVGFIYGFIYDRGGIGWSRWSGPVHDAAAHGRASAHTRLNAGAALLTSVAQVASAQSTALLGCCGGDRRRQMGVHSRTPPRDPPE